MFHTSNVALVIIIQLFSNKKIKNEYINCYFDSKHYTKMIENYNIMRKQQLNTA